MRHENGNCTPVGGFCTAVNDPICEGLHSAYDAGWHAAALRAQQEAEKNEPLTMAELLEMPGEPVWCAEYQCYGIVKVETVGCWANKPYLVGSWHDPKYGTAVDFEYDIKKRGLTLYRRKLEEKHETI